MKLLLDMGLARRTAYFLRNRGYDAVHLREQNLQRLTDEDVIAKGRLEERVIVTHDLDYGRIVALSRSHLPSVITLRLSNMEPDQVNRYLEYVLSRFADQLAAGALISVSEQGVRVRALPV